MKLYPLRAPMENGYVSIDDFRKSQGIKFSANFPAATELRHLIVGPTLLSLLCSKHTRMEAVCEKTRDFSKLSDLQALFVCVRACVRARARVCVCVSVCTPGVRQSV